MNAAEAAIRRAIADHGPITVAEFMELSLGHPEGGYYTAATARPVREGDFLTAPELHPIFGAAVSRQLAEVWAHLGEPAEFTLVEYGAGGGTLALSILAGLRADGCGLADALRYAPLELNPHRRAELAVRAAAAGLPVVAPGEPTTGAVLANEFLDALPVHVVEVRDGALREIQVTEADGAFAEVALPPSTPALAARLSELSADGVVLAEGQRAEICLALDDWAAEVGRRIARGLVIAIDYGAPARDLYGPRRHAGTLMTYRGHRADGSPGAQYRDIGERDITAHVDVTTLARRLAAAGFEIDRDTSQARFLAGCGLQDLLERERAASAEDAERWLLVRSAILRLLDPRQMGGFRVVVATRGLPPGAPLIGLGYRGPG